VVGAFLSLGISSNRSQAKVMRGFNNLGVAVFLSFIFPQGASSIVKEPRSNGHNQVSAVERNVVISAHFTGSTCWKIKNELTE
jgi:hypothetical protein